MYKAKEEKLAIVIILKDMFLSFYEGYQHRKMGFQSLSQLKIPNASIFKLIQGLEL